MVDEATAETQCAEEETTHPIAGSKGALASTTSILASATPAKLSLLQATTKTLPAVEMQAGIMEGATAQAVPPENVLEQVNSSPALVLLGITTNASSAAVMQMVTECNAAMSQAGTEECMMVQSPEMLEQLLTTPPMLQRAGLSLPKMAQADILSLGILPVSTASPAIVLPPSMSTARQQENALHAKPVALPVVQHNVGWLQ